MLSSSVLIIYQSLFSSVFFVHKRFLSAANHFLSAAVLIHDCVSGEPRELRLSLAHKSGNEAIGDLGILG